MLIECCKRRKKLNSDSQNNEILQSNKKNKINIMKPNTSAANQMSEVNKLVALRSLNRIAEVNIMTLRDEHEPSIFSQTRDEEATIGSGFKTVSFEKRFRA